MVNVKSLASVMLALLVSLAISETFACRDLIQAIRRQRFERLMQSNPQFIQDYGITNPSGQGFNQGSAPLNSNFRNNMVNPSASGQNQMRQQQFPNQQQQFPTQQQQQTPNQMQQGTQGNQPQQTSGQQQSQQQNPGQQLTSSSGQQSANTLQRRNSSTN